MKNPWHLSEEVLKERGGIYTAKEICQQPQAWCDTLEILEKEKAKIEEFTAKLLAKENLRIIFTGAGTSAYVGDTIAPYLREKTGKRIESIATTDIVAGPEQFLTRNVPTLLVSFARSGDSPESVATYDLAEQVVSEIYQIVITCNENGTLARRAQKNSENTLVVLTPKQTNDLGFAMTSSFTCMLIAGLMIFDLHNFAENKDCVGHLAACAEKMLEKNHGLTALAQNAYARIVFLGSGSLHGLAKEASLKVMELTSGNIISVSESILGFRHGPKSIINDNTLIIMFLSNNCYTRCYEMDFLRELSHDGSKCEVVGISLTADEEALKWTDMMLIVDDADKKVRIDDAYQALGYIVYAHIFALAVSMAQGITPDNPRPDGSLNRVVKGVNLYPFSV